MRIGVTGSRDWSDGSVIAEALEAAAARPGGFEGPECRGRVELVHGAAEGADRLAAEYGRSQGWIVESHPADWRLYGRAAGMRRNAEMVAAGADVWLAFIAACTRTDCGTPGPHGSHGASHCAGLAERAGIPTRRFTP